MIGKMSAEELKEKMDKNESYTLVDCREQAEWDEGHIPGAKFLPLSKLEEEYEKLGVDDEIIMQCRSGKRSMRACEFLESKGYKHLTNLEGGILNWMDEGYEIEN